VKPNSQAARVGGAGLVADEKVLVLDFGAQYAQLIARRVREQHVYCEIVRHDITADRVRELAPRGIILSGGPASVYEPGAPKCDPEIFRLGIPVLGICYGLQILNVYRSGTLVQHIESPVNHEAGKQVAVAHEVKVEGGSKLAAIVRTTENVSENAGKGTASSRAENLFRPGDGTTASRALSISVNSSHHQSAHVIGDGLKIAARCPEDGIVEALEGTSPDHFVLAVQWHPERSFDDDENSRAIFRALVEAAKQRHEKLSGEFEGQSHVGEGPVRLRSGQVRATRSNG